MARNEIVQHLASYHGREALSFICRVGNTALRLLDMIDITQFDVTFASFTSDSSNGTPIITETATGVSIEPPISITLETALASTSPIISEGMIRLNSHNLPNGTEIVYTASATPYGSLTSGQRYFVRDAKENFFNLCHYSGSPAIPLTDESGTHVIQILGQVIYTPQSNACYPAIGDQYGCFFVERAIGSQTYPRSRFPEIEEQNDGGMILIRVK